MFRSLRRWHRGWYAPSFALSRLGTWRSARTLSLLRPHLQLLSPLVLSHPRDRQTSQSEFERLVHRRTSRTMADEQTLYEILNHDVPWRRRARAPFRQHIASRQEAVYSKEHYEFSRNSRRYSTQNQWAPRTTCEKAAHTWSLKVISCSTCSICSIVDASVSSPGTTIVSGSSLGCHLGGVGGMSRRVSGILIAKLQPMFIVSHQHVRHILVM